MLFDTCCWFVVCCWFVWHLLLVCCLLLVCLTLAVGLLFVVGLFDTCCWFVVCCWFVWHLLLVCCLLLVCLTLAYFDVFQNYCKLLEFLWCTKNAKFLILMSRWPKLDYIWGRGGWGGGGGCLGVCGLGFRWDGGMGIDFHQNDNMGQLRAKIIILDNHMLTNCLYYNVDFSLL